jgi:hypothetical protein
MSNFTKRILFTVGILLALHCQGRTASAQCSSVTLQFGNISLQRGNPFQGEYSTTMTPAPLSRMTLPSPPALHSVARDSEGRVREERVAGKFKVKTADGAESEQEQHLITICDPVSQKFIRLDTLNKTATIMGPRSVLPRPGFALQRLPQPFCSSYFKRYSSMPRMQSEDLGSQTISGVDAQGLRTWMVLDAPAASGAQRAPSYQDHWCSEELGAIVMQAFASAQVGRRNETVLKNIERREPDAALFQIPPDYTIEQRAMDSDLRPGLLPLETFPKPSSPQ